MTLLEKILCTCDQAASKPAREAEAAARRGWGPAPRRKCLRKYEAHALSQPADISLCFDRSPREGVVSLTEDHCALPYVVTGKAIFTNV